jgi:TatD DNase family protein
MLIDSHCHLNHIEAYSVPEMLFLAQSKEVTHFLTICVEKKDINELRKLVKTHDNIKASIGIHPCDIQNHDRATIYEEIKHTLNVDSDIFIGIGETGLDYYHSTQYKKLQQESFEKHIEIAKLYNRPVIVHSRKAPDDTVAILKNHKPEKVIIHCFTEDEKMAKKCLDAGYTLSFSGIITFKNAQYLRDIVSMVPLEQLLVETDSPYLAPSPFRGKVNQPAYVTEVVRKVAEIKNVTYQKIADTTSSNFRNLFGWPVI